MIIVSRLVDHLIRHKIIHVRFIFIWSILVIEFIGLESTWIMNEVSDFYIG